MDKALAYNNNTNGGHMQDLKVANRPVRSLLSMKFIYSSDLPPMISSCSYYPIRSMLASTTIQNSSIFRLTMYIWRIV